MTEIGLILLRVALSVVLVAHGAHKLFGMWGGPAVGPGGLDQTALQFTAMQLEPGFLMAVLAGLIQFAGGLLIGVGFLTRYAAAAAIGYLAIGAWKEHLQWGFFLNWVNAPGRGQGIEYNLVLAAALGCLILAGPGDWSIDGSRASRAASRAAGRARLRRG